MGEGLVKVNVRRAITLLALLPFAIIGTACGSQLEGLQPVGGDLAYGVRVAAIDVLLRAEVPMKVVPVCQEVDSQVTCSGTAMTDAPIVITTAGPNADTMTIAVDRKTVFVGSVAKILDDAVSAP